MKALRNPASKILLVALSAAILLAGFSLPAPRLAHAQTVAECATVRDYSLRVASSGNRRGYSAGAFGSISPTDCTLDGKTLRVEVLRALLTNPEPSLRLALDYTDGSNPAADVFPETITISRVVGRETRVVTFANPGTLTVRSDGGTYRDYSVASFSPPSLTNNLIAVNNAFGSNVNVNARFTDSNTAPVVTVAAAPAMVIGGGTVTLTGTVVDPEGHSVTHAWTQTGATGTFSATNIASPTWTAPAATNVVQTTTLTLTATDSLNLSGADSVAVSTRSNRNPTLTMDTQPTHLNGGGTVTLAITAADPDGEALTYAWTQTGATGAFSASDVAAPTWTAPAATSAVQTTTVAVTVTNRSNLTATANVVLTTRSNVAPSVSIDNPAATLVGEQVVNLSVTATDPNGEALTYAWSQTGTPGTFSALNVANPSWTAPEEIEQQRATNLIVEVTNRAGLSATATVTFLTRRTPRPSVTIDTPAAFVNGGQRVNLFVTATDPQNSALTYSWSQTGAAGVFSATNIANPSWTAPATTSALQRSTLTLEVTNVSNLSASATVVFTTRSNQPPTVSIVTVAGNVNGGQVVSLDALASDSNGETLTFVWTQAGAAGTFSDTAILEPDWTAPTATNVAQTATLTLTVRNRANIEATASVILTVRANQPPVVTIATPAAILLGNQSLTLAASASDPEGLRLTYAWTQSGAAGTFSATNIPTPRWRAPPPAANSQEATLTLTATDQSGASGSASVTFTIRSNQPPTVSIVTGPTSVAGETDLAINASALDPEGHALLFQWTANPNVGSFRDATVLDATWTAPTPTELAQQVTLTLTVQDPLGVNASASLAVTVPPAVPLVEQAAVTDLGLNDVRIAVGIRYPGAASQVYARYQSAGGASWVSATAVAAAATVQVNISNLTSGTAYVVQVSLFSDYSSPTAVNFTTPDDLEIGTLEFFDLTSNGVTARVHVNHLFGNQETVYFSYRQQGADDWLPAVAGQATDAYRDFQLTDLQEDQTYEARSSLSDLFLLGETSTGSFTPTREPSDFAPSRGFSPADVVCAVGTIPNCPAIYVFVVPLLIVGMLFWMGQFEGLGWCRHPLVMFLAPIAGMGATVTAINPNPIVVTITVVACLGVAGGGLRASRAI